MDMKNLASFSLFALLFSPLTATAVSFPENLGQPVSPKPQDIVLAAKTANEALENAVNAAGKTCLTTDGSGPKSMTSDLSAATFKMNNAERALLLILSSPHFDISGKQILDASENVSAMVDSKDPRQTRGHDMADTYDYCVLQAKSADPNADAVWTDLALEIARANMRRSLLEFKKTVRQVAGKLMQAGDKTITSENISRLDQEIVQASYDSPNDLKKEILGAPASVRDLLYRSAVFAMPTSVP